MYSKIDYEKINQHLISKKESKDIIGEMVDVLDLKQLKQIINILKEPFYLNVLNDYLIDDNLPDENSTEFLFLCEAEKFNGNIVRKQMNQAGISNYYLDKFIQKYRLKEITTSAYVFPNKRIDSSFLFQSHYSKAVISHETALYLLNLSDVIPQMTIMSMPNDYKISQLEKNANQYIKIYNIEFNSNKALVLEYDENDPILITKNIPIEENNIMMKQTSSNNLVRVTSAERTIADILIPKSNVEEEVKHVALRRYFDSKESSLNRLRRIAKSRNVLKELDKYLWELQLN